MKPHEKRVALYCRTSTDHQNTEIQKRELLAFAEARGWTVYQIYEDAGVSGTHGNRPALRKLMQDARQRNFALVVTWKLDRFFRSLKDLVNTIQELTDLGVEFASLKDSIDLTTASGRLMIHLLAAFAEFEAAPNPRRVCAGLANAKAKGVKLGRPCKRDDRQIRTLRSKAIPTENLRMR